MQLPVTETGGTSAPGNWWPMGSTQDEPAWFTLSRWDRLVCFGVCIVSSAVFFVLCFALFPVLILRPVKLAALWTIGSLIFIISFGVLQGPVNYIQHLTSLNRLPFTVAYFGSIIATLAFSLGMHSPILTIIACVVQILAAIWYTVSYFPMGTQGLRVATRFGARRVNAWFES
ncbi:Got1/Sft2-like family-domain-containing protein [Dipodascopsis tothii]|uniref:Got1/Sft2-like family-domain-containing protein n=1 Tax=Dipodascopsis tothii TaxID=44089 RepID=UPI0034CF9788